MSETLATISLRIVTLAKGAGTKIAAVSIWLFVWISLMESYTGIPSTFCPAFQGLVLVIIFVPAESMAFVRKLPWKLLIS